MCPGIGGMLEDNPLLCMFQNPESALSVELICQNRQIWFVDGDEILVSPEIANQRDREVPKDMLLQPAKTQWSQNAPWRDTLVSPKLIQVRASTSIHVTKQSKRLGECSACSLGMVRPLFLTSPLYLEKPGFWSTIEIPSILLFSEDIRDFFTKVEPDWSFWRFTIFGRYKNEQNSI